MLVGAAQNGWFSAYKNGRVLCFIQAPKSDVVVILRHFPVIPVLQCFYLTKLHRLISVGSNRTIKAWSFEDGTYSILVGNKFVGSETCNVVTMAGLSSDESMLALTMTDNSFEIYNVQQSETISLSYNHGKTLDSPLKCCCFSHSGKILAFGQDNGNIVVSFLYDDFFKYTQNEFPNKYISLQ